MSVVFIEVPGILIALIGVACVALGYNAMETMYAVMPRVCFVVGLALVIAIIAYSARGIIGLSKRGRVGSALAYLIGQLTYALPVLLSMYVLAAAIPTDAKGFDIIVNLVGYIIVAAFVLLYTGVTASIGLTVVSCEADEINNYAAGGDKEPQCGAFLGESILVNGISIGILIFFISGAFWTVLQALWAGLCAVAGIIDGMFKSIGL